MKFTVAALAVLISSTSVVSAATADPVEGVWATPGGHSKVRIEPCRSDPARMCGVFVWFKNPTNRDGSPKLDSANPDPKLKSRPLAGMLFIRDFKKAGPGRWTGGKIYDPSSGKTYASKMQAQAGGDLKLEGCVLVVCKAQTWKRSSL